MAAFVQRHRRAGYVSAYVALSFCFYTVVARHDVLVFSCLGAETTFAARARALTFQKNRLTSN